MEVQRDMIKGIPEFVRNIHGDKAFNKWIKAVPSQAAELFMSGDYNNEWYDAREYFTLPMLALCRLFYKGSLKGVREQAKYDVDLWVKGIRLLIVRLLPEAFMVKKMLEPDLHRYYRIVDTKFYKIEKGQWVFAILGLDETEGTAAERFAGAVDEILRLKGKKNITVQVERSRKEHKLYTMFEVNYEN